jgi:hypothetical protein
MTRTLTNLLMGRPRWAVLIGLLGYRRPASQNNAEGSAIRASRPLTLISSPQTLTNDPVDDWSPFPLHAGRGAWLHL